MRVGKLFTVSWRYATVALFFSIVAPSAQAIDVALSTEHHFVEIKENGGGGISYLPDGDLLTFTIDFVAGPTIQRVDANGDGLPVGGKKIIKNYDASLFPNFITVSPSGTFALAGIGETVVKVDLATDQVSDAFTAPGNYDLVFINDTTAYLSSNPGGFNPSIPNRISLVQLSAAPTLTPVAELSATPSGPIALNESGDLYYIKGTFSFPPPAGSSRLLKFSAAALADAAATGLLLEEADSNIDLKLEGGYDIVFHRGDTGGDDLFISTIGNQIFRLQPGSAAPEVFATVNDSASASAPALTALSFFEPTQTFGGTTPTRSVLGMSVATNFFSDNSLLQIRPVSFDSDADGTIDTADTCRFDPAKVTEGTCGCGVIDADTNGDKIVDCGTPRVFEPALSPTLGSFAVTGKTLKLGLEKLAEAGLTYRIEIVRLDRRGKVNVIETKSSSLRIRDLKKGRYRIRYRIVQKSGRKVRQSKSSMASTITIK